jgi:hypothetical protein
MKKDLPGQMGLDGKFIKQPDEACAKCAVPLVPPKRPIFQKVKAKRRVFNLFAGGGKVRILHPDQFTEIEQ